MPVLKNAKHERFVQGLAKGKSATSAYVAAGFQANEGNAGRLNRNEQVQRRLRELQSRAARRTETTVESLTKELEQVRKAALKDGQASAAVSAIMGKAKLHGLGSETKKLIGKIGVYDLTKVPDAQLDTLEAILGPIADAGGDQSGEE